MKTIKYVFLVLLILPLTLKSQNLETSKIVHHDHHKHEIGIGSAPVYFLKEKELSFGLHIHYLYNLPHTKFGLGVGYEKIFDEHRHNSFVLTFSYRLVDKLNFSISPGFASENNEFRKSVFAVHLETSYEIEFNDFHLGPVLEIAADKEDYHMSMGLHIGIGF
jgi:hypothetical protein